jgi:hypothetical protein
MFKFLDAYSIRARLFPALLAAAPAFAALALLISWERIALSNVIATTALVVLVFALADFARKLGLRVEPKIYGEMGGKPSVVMFRRSDTTIEEPTKDRYRTFIAGKIKQPALTAQQEADDQAAADSFYEACGTWLRANTRDAKKFPPAVRRECGLRLPSQSARAQVASAGPERDRRRHLRGSAVASQPPRHGQRSDHADGRRTCDRGTSRHVFRLRRHQGWRQ